MLATASTISSDIIAMVIRIIGQMTEMIEWRIDHDRNISPTMTYAIPTHYVQYFPEPMAIVLIICDFTRVSHRNHPTIPLQSPMKAPTSLPIISTINIAMSYTNFQNMTHASTMRHKATMAMIVLTGMITPSWHGRMPAH